MHSKPKAQGRVPAGRPMTVVISSRLATYCILSTLQCVRTAFLTVFFFLVGLARYEETSIINTTKRREKKKKEKKKKCGTINIGENAAAAIPLSFLSEQHLHKRHIPHT